MIEGGRISTTAMMSKMMLRGYKIVTYQIVSLFLPKKLKIPSAMVVIQVRVSVTSMMGMLH